MSLKPFPLITKESNSFLFYKIRFHEKGTKNTKFTKKKYYSSAMYYFVCFVIVAGVMVAVLPVVKCNFCPPASFISTDSIPNDRKIFFLLAVLIPRKSPGIYSLKFASAGFK